MRRLTALTLALALVCVPLVGCGRKAATGKPKSAGATHRQFASDVDGGRRQGAQALGLHRPGDHHARDDPAAPRLRRFRAASVFHLPHGRSQAEEPDRDHAGEVRVAAQDPSRPGLSHHHGAPALRAPVQGDGTAGQAGHDHVRRRVAQPVRVRRPAPQEVRDGRDLLHQPAADLARLPGLSVAGYGPEARQGGPRHRVAHVAASQGHAQLGTTPPTRSSARTSANSSKPTIGSARSWASSPSRCATRSASTISRQSGWSLRTFAVSDACGRRRECCPSGSAEPQASPSYAHCWFAAR